jgi:hypothetical protein
MSKIVFSTLRSCLPKAIPLSALVAICLYVSYLHPLKIAQKEGVLDTTQVEQKVLQNALREAETAEEASVKIDASIKTRIDTIRKEVAGAEKDSSRLKRIDGLIDAFKRANDRQKPSVKALGFVQSKVHYLYFCALFFLTCHLMLMGPELLAAFGTARLFLRRTGAGAFFFAIAGVVAACVAAFLCLYSRSWYQLNYARATDLDTYGRTVFSFVHKDIGRLSYDAQNNRSLGVCVLIVASWLSSWIREVVASKEVATWRFESIGAPPVKELVRSLLSRKVQVKEAFRAWQIHSLCLAAAFLPWAQYYWSLKDNRYDMSNLMFQIIWGITWWLATAPAFRLASGFEAYREELVKHLLCDANDSGALLEVVRAEKPVSFVSVAGSGFAATATYLAPLLHKILS